MESEIRTCVCIKCKNTQNEMINYERATCSHVIHAILTLFTLFWGIIWWMRWQKSKADTKAQTVKIRSRKEKINGLDQNQTIHQVLLQNMQHW